MEQRRSLDGQVILVVGGAGFIGSHLVDALLEANAAEVAVVDNLFLGREENLEPAIRSGRVIFYKDDAQDASFLDYVFSRHRIDTVFNCATKPLNYSFVNPQGAFTTSVTIAVGLCELLRRKKYTTLCQFSSSEVYGSAQYEPMDEKHPCAPTTTYAAGKLAADFAVSSYAGLFGLDAYIVRPFNNYGPRQNCEGPLAAVVPATIRRICAGLPPRVEGDGAQTRDCIFVKDCVAAILKLHECAPPGTPVNIGTGKNVKIGELVRTICRALRYTGVIETLPARHADVRSHLACVSLLRSLIDFSPRPLDDGIEETVRWYREKMTR